MKITDEAVEAVAKALNPDLWADESLVPEVLRNSARWQKRHDVRAALEAALPHLEGATPVADPQRIAEVLADHQLQDGVGKWLGQYRTEYTCDCGAPVVTDAHAEVSLLAARVTHQAEALAAASLFRDSGPVVPDHVHCEHRETRPDEYGAMRCTYCGLVF